MPNNFKKLKVTKLPNSEAEITGEIPLPFLVELRKDAIEHLGKHVDIPGFRQGKIPEDVLIKKVGEMRILEETAEIAIAREYDNILKESKLSVVGRPHVAITKLAPGVDLEFKIKVAVEPEFSLPNYKKIAKEVYGEKLEIKVEDAQIDEVMKELEGKDIKAELKEGETLRDKVKENMEKEQEYRAEEKRRITLLEKLVEATDIEVPQVMVESELAKMLAQFKDDVTKIGLKWEDYLGQLNKSEEDMRKEWEPKAKDRAKAELILAKVADKEKIEPDPKELEEQVSHLLSHYPDADPMRARIYMYIQLRNQKVFEKLEKEAK